MAAAEASGGKKCPKCGNSVSDLLRIDAGMRLRIQETLGEEQVSDEVCPNCYKSISATISRGAKLRAEQTARDQNKLILWRSRVNLVKQGRNLVTQKAYSEAAVAFEKYLRILEVIYDKKPGELAPELFKDSARTKEITVVASVLWDLIRIYDTSPRYGDRQKKAAAKLIEFLKFSPLQSEIIRKAKQFEAQSKNPGVIRDFVKKAGNASARCFIATAAYQDPEALEVLILRNFRDQIIKNSFGGRQVIAVYYFTSPPIAKVIDKSPWAQRALRKIFGAFAPWLSQKYNLHETNHV